MCLRWIFSSHSNFLSHSGVRACGTKFDVAHSWSPVPCLVLLVDSSTAFHHGLFLTKFFCFHCNFLSRLVTMMDNDYYSDPNGSNEDEDYRNLEVGITSLSLLSAAANSKSSHNRKGTGSTVSSYSPPEFLTPSSPRPPSAPKAMPSPICKPNHNVSNTSSTSPSLTLTPNSSDGNPESFSSHIVHAPPLPYLQAQPEHRRNDSLANSLTGSIGSAPENDGLLGLEALHRDHGILSSSLGSGNRMNINQLQPPPPSTIASHRPPLSQSYNEMYSDRSVGGYSWKSDSHAMNLSIESLESTSNPVAQSSRSSMSLFGTVIGNNSSNITNNGSSSPHHQLPAHPNYETAARRRASSQDAYYDVSSKFGSFPTLSAHKQQQLLEQQQHQQVSKPRHMRSISGPQPITHEGQAVGLQQQHQQSFRFANEYASSQNPYKMNTSVARSASLTHSSMEVSDHSNGPSTVPHGVSMPNLLQQSVYSYGGCTASVGSHMMERRDNLDFHISPGNSVNENINFGDSSPNSFYYSSHARQGSDNSSMLLSSQSLPVMNSLRPQQLRHRSTSSDDYDHPLVGEHIEVPDPHEEAVSSGSNVPYLITGAQQQQHPLLRNATHSHSMSLDAIPAPFTSPMLPPAPAPKVVFVVKFKRSQRNFVLGPRITRDLKVGTYVKVEADRGEDLGIVVGKLPFDKFRSSFTAGSGLGTSSANDLKRIVRLATHDEVSLLGMKREEEEELLQICRTKVRQRGLPMNVVDAEYQFDRHKLTFFFEAEGRVDFRELVRDLFSMYKTRIWMQQLDKNTSTSSPAILAPSTHLDIDYGTPIIAPASEFADSIIFNSFVGPGSN
jgi:hypothetical protein